MTDERRRFVASRPRLLDFAVPANGDRQRHRASGEVWRVVGLAAYGRVRIMRSADGRKRTVWGDYWDSDRWEPCANALAEQHANDRAAVDAYLTSSDPEATLSVDDDG